MNTNDSNTKAASVNSVTAEHAMTLLSLLESMHAVVATHYDAKTDKTQVLGPFLSGGENATRQWATIVERAVSRLDHFQKSQIHAAREALKNRIEEHCLLATVEYEDSLAAALALPEKTRKACGFSIKDHVLVPVADLLGYFDVSDKGSVTVETATEFLVKKLGYSGRIGKGADGVVSLRVPFVPKQPAANVGENTDGASI